MINVLSFQQALEKGFEPREYPYDIESVPLGNIRANLEFKIYAKKAVAITCYFALELSDRKFALTVYRQKGLEREYKLPNCSIDFQTCATDQLYEITTEKNSKGNIKFANASYAK